MCAYGDTCVENVSWMKKNHMVDEILLLCHEILNKVAELRVYRIKNAHRNVHFLLGDESGNRYHLPKALFTALAAS